MNPSLMQLCGFYIGGLCVLNGTSVRTCWPCGGVGLSSVGLSEAVIVQENVKQGELVSVQLFHDPLQEAVEVTLSSRLVLQIECEYLDNFVIFNNISIIYCWPSKLINSWYYFCCRFLWRGFIYQWKCIHFVTSLAVLWIQKNCHQCLNFQLKVKLPNTLSYKEQDILKGWWLVIVNETFLSNFGFHVSVSPVLCSKMTSFCISLIDH